tara:strand:- start:810 stop:1025 length:216 start_codon:yes stop_codon:yes gene_type:complete
MTEQQNKIIVDEKEYDVSDLDDKEMYYLKQVKILRQRIADARFNLDQLTVAESAFASTLIKSLSKETSDEK